MAPSVLSFFMALSTSLRSKPVNSTIFPAFNGSPAFVMASSTFSLLSILNVLMNESNRNTNIMIEMRLGKVCHSGSSRSLFFKYKIHRKNEKDESYDMIGPDGFVFECYYGKYHKNN